MVQHNDHTYLEKILKFEDNIPPLKISSFHYKVDPGKILKDFGAKMALFKQGQNSDGVQSTNSINTLFGELW